MLVPEDASRSALGGFLRVGGAELRVRVCGVRYAPEDGRALLDAAELQAEPALAALLRPHAASLRVRLAQSTSLDGFLRELEELVAVSQRSDGTGGRPQVVAAQLPSAEHYTRLLDELDAVGWRHVALLSDDLRSLELRVLDAAHRPHCVRVLLPDDYGSRLASGRRLECFADAPEPFQVAVDASSASTDGGNLLASVLRQFEAFLTRFQGFWDVLDDLDASTCVLEPRHPTRATGRRRLALDKHVSVQVEIDPSRPQALCQLALFGSDAAVVPLRERWSSSLLQWDVELPVRENLARALGVSFPSPAERSVDEFAIECGICYSYRLELDDAEDTTGTTAHSVGKEPRRTATPDRLCENASCSRPFHDKCLFDWLKALPTARQSFSTVFGECPYCRETISAKFMA